MRPLPPVVVFAVAVVPIVFAIEPLLLPLAVPLVVVEVTDANALLRDISRPDDSTIFVNANMHLIVSSSVYCEDVSQNI